MNLIIIIIIPNENDFNVALLLIVTLLQCLSVWTHMIMFKKKEIIQFYLFNTKTRKGTLILERGFK